ncbi:unnamed protein product [Linum tenue]|uniref:AAA+ ATPase domain-containing protein n=1 Tax=Linum tenue TaxID=586396 RepID=A0AAV0NE65_9ROSI|nr:unnamed protein product [Linum tenue]
MMSRIPSLSEIFSWILTLITSLRIPAPSEIFSWYASLTTTAMMARTAVRDFLPAPAQQYLHALAQSLFGRRLPPGLTLIFDATTGYARNEIFDAAEAYLATKINHDTDCLHVTKTAADKNLFFSFENNERIVDKFRGLELTWRFFRSPGSPSLGGGRGDPSNPAGSIASPEKRCFQLSFPKEHKELVLGSYIPFVLDELKATRHEERVLKIHTLDNKNYHHIGPWNSVNLDHPATFDTLAMEPSLKEAIVQDLDRFRSRKDFYRRVGRAWKRGYLLYGPPGTGKSSLIGAMANYLKFDVYDLQLASVQDDCDLRRVLLATGNRSILVIEDIDCGADLPDRNEKKKKPVQASTVYPYDPYARQPKITLSGLLNFIDGLWSSCGDERIIVFTTNHKEKLDPALLRPGRMDMHVHMSYCTLEAFKVLASNYLEADGGSHRLCEEIGGLIGDVRVTPAQVAEELMKSNDADVALGEVVSLLKRKRVEAAMAKPEIDKEEEEEEEKVGDGEEDGSAVFDEMDKQLINGDVKGHKADPVGWNKLVKSMSTRNVTLRRRRR